MITTIVLFGIAWLLRENSTTKPGYITLLFEFLGSITISIGGWLGGTLVNRNFIGPDHRYAHSGKWKESTLEAKRGESIEIGKSDELKVDQMKLLRVDGERIVLARTEEGYVAFQERCTHGGGSLADGILICGTIQCLWHGSQFDVKAGFVKAGPATEKIRIYPLIEKDGKIILQI